ncbi:molybdopterin molybdotransferase MoeA [Candidatus Nitrospira allomarina]|uniref:Molybdopterin molybdenumtransferase n=1 Tax=Candidatus Nitrospira allomarina TaxID=3020900 RepID=A0AA96JR94_9BACT|nr:gephyrin-like molybdotransferase Glp [Candidatus Nitrospira allomarina]WNM57282.1 molybdopterin molybdotransferase MoeA [Candidatus Nitrospira allomarina]
MDQLTSLTSAQQTVLDAAHPLGCEKIGLLDSLGRILGEDILAPRSNPPWDNSAMDGFAVRWADIKQDYAITRIPELHIVEDVAAGAVATKAVGPGEAIRIMTGAPMPAGADTVVRVEYTEPSGTKVRIMKIEAGQGSNIRPKGEDVTEGECIIPKGTQLRSGEIGMLAILAKSFVLVSQRPRVAILSTGDELADLDESFNEHKIVNSNSYGIAAAVQESGGIPVLLGIAKDNPDSLKDKIRQGLTCDILVLSGGVSMGDYDFTKPVFAELGADMNFWKLAIRPGQPVAFGKIQGKLAFGLPGNPVSSMVTFDQLVRPAMLKMGGHRKWERPVVKALFQETFSKHTDRRHFLRGILQQENGVLTVRTTGGQGSGILTSMVKANGFIDVPEEVESLKPGDLVNVQLLSRNF